MSEEHQRHTGARLEAFSDIVFGFSLAQLALTLPPPYHFTAGRWFDVAVFAFTFGFVSFIWWRHHLIFRDFFVPDGLSIVLNFMLLAAVALMAYALEAYLHGHDTIAPVVLYATVFGIMFASAGLMVARGLAKRSGIDDKTRYTGKRISLTYTTIGAIFLASLFLIPFGARWIVYAWLVVPIARAVITRALKREAVIP